MNRKGLQFISNSVRKLTTVAHICQGKTYFFTAKYDKTFLTSSTRPSLLACVSFKEKQALSKQNVFFAPITRAKIGIHDTNKETNQRLTFQNSNDWKTKSLKDLTIVSFSRKTKH